MQYVCSVVVLIDSKMFTFLAALEKIRGEFIKDVQKSSDHSSESNDESHYDNGDERRLGAKKKRLLSVPKRDQLIQTIYTGNDNMNYESTPSLETGGV